jgi:hypothetical protein
MRRYLVGPRATANKHSGLVVCNEPPSVWRPPIGLERISFPGVSYDFNPKRGMVEEFRSQTGQQVIAREFPAAWDAQLLEHDEAVAQAEKALNDARAARQELLETIAPIALTLRVKDLRADKEAWDASPEAAARRAAKAAELESSREFMKKMNGVMARMVR